MAHGQYILHFFFFRRANPKSHRCGEACVAFYFDHCRVSWHCLCNGFHDKKRSEPKALSCMLTLPRISGHRYRARPQTGFRLNHTIKTLYYIANTARTKDCRHAGYWSLSAVVSAICESTPVLPSIANDSRNQNTEPPIFILFLQLTEHEHRTEYFFIFWGLERRD